MYPHSHASIYSHSLDPLKSPLSCRVPQKLPHSIAAVILFFFISNLFSVFILQSSVFSSTVLLDVQSEKKKQPKSNHRMALVGRELQDQWVPTQTQSSPRSVPDLCPFCMTSVEAILAQRQPCEVTEISMVPWLPYFTWVCYCQLLSSLAHIQLGK